MASSKSTVQSRIRLPGTNYRISSDDGVVTILNLRNYCMKRIGEASLNRYCAAISNSDGDFILHHNKVHDEKFAKCQFCKDGQIYHNMRKHWKQCVSFKQLKAKNLQKKVMLCEYPVKHQFGTVKMCGYQFKARDQVQIHLKKAHGLTKKQPALSSPENHRLFNETRKEVLNDLPAKIHHSPIVPIGNRKTKFRCQKCLTYFKSAEILRHHNKAFTKDAYCFVCNKILCTFHNLIDHLKEFHPATEFYKCIFCHRPFPTYGDQQEHVRGHVQQALAISKGTLKLDISRCNVGLQCEKCGKIFMEPYKLHRHLSGTKKCECGLVFCTNIYLREHVKQDH